LFEVTTIGQSGLPWRLVSPLLSRQGNRIWRFVGLRASRIECKASKPDAEFHGV